MLVGNMVMLILFQQYTWELQHRPQMFIDTDLFVDITYNHFNDKKILTIADIKFLISSYVNLSLKKFIILMITFSKLISSY